MRVAGSGERGGGRYRTLTEGKRERANCAVLRVGRKRTGPIRKKPYKNGPIRKKDIKDRSERNKERTGKVVWNILRAHHRGEIMTLELVLPFACDLVGVRIRVSITRLRN